MTSIGSFFLDEEYRKQLRAHLIRAGLKGVESEVDKLAEAISSCTSAFDTEEAGTTKFRPTHDALRRLWLLCSKRTPNMPQIRQLAGRLPRPVLIALEKRAKNLWPKLLGPEFGPRKFMNWARDASDEELVLILRICISDAAVPVSGRLRSAGRRSGSHLEPNIMGVVRRGEIAESGGPTPVAKSPSGRPRQQSVDNLVMYLAVDWAKVTGNVPTSGRSDKKPFGEFVHSIFSWIDRTDADSALRRYWGAVGREKNRPSRSR